MARQNEWIALRFKHCIRKQAAEALGKTQSKKALEQLIATLKKETDNERYCSQSGRPCSTSGTPSPYAEVAASAAEALGNLNNPRATEPLILALKCEPTISEYPNNVMLAIAERMEQNDPHRNAREAARKAILAIERKAKKGG